MPPQSDLEIARSARLLPIEEVGRAAGIPAEMLEPRGTGVAKVSLEAIARLEPRPRAKYVMVTATTPTPLGEGKTTTAVGLAQGFGKLGRRATVALRQPSLGPTFGIKGGAAGGGYSQVLPMERLNLHLTGDFHAVGAAHDLCAAMVDAHIFHDKDPDLDPERVSWRRVLDVNDRALRDVTLGPGGTRGLLRRTGFDITAASEIMSVLALATSVTDLRERMGRIVVGRDRSGAPVTAEQIGAAGAMTVLVLDAVQPNLLQTIEGGPALVHTGPFGNISLGSSSVIADLLGVRCGEYHITEAGFGADMGAERFFNIKCRVSGLTPDAAVVVVTTRALKAHSGRYRLLPGRPLPEALVRRGPDLVEAGGANLVRHVEIVRLHGVTPVVAVNVFPDDHEDDLRAVERLAESLGVRCVRATHFGDGGDGARDLAEAVAEAAAEDTTFRFLYPDEMSLASKIETIAKRVYGADGVAYSDRASAQLGELEDSGFGHLPVCVAKTHLSLSADPELTGAPVGWTLPVRDVEVSAGAGFVYPLCGDVNTMPGLGRDPAATRIDIDATGAIVGLA